MKTITKKFNIYTFDELSEEIKNELIEEEIEENEEELCENFLQDKLKIKAEELLKENFGEKALFLNITYDLDVLRYVNFI